MKIVIYIGNQQVFNLQKPEQRAFYYGVPVGVHDDILNYLPIEDFEEYNEKKYKGMLKPCKPVLIRLPLTILWAMASIAGIKRIIEIHPTAKIKLLSLNNKLNIIYNSIFPGLEIINSYKVIPGQFLKEYNLTPSKSICEFSAATLMKHTAEFALMNNVGIRLIEESSNKPNILLSEKKKHIAIITNGATLGSGWKEMADYLINNDLGYPIKIIDSIDQFADIKSAQFCISCGDSELSMIAAYYGVPMFIFIKNTNSLLLYQLMRFNDVKQGSIAFSPPVHHKPIEEIFQSLLQYIKSIILNETPIETKIPAKRKRNKLVING